MYWPARPRNLNVVATTVMEVGDKIPRLGEPEILDQMNYIVATRVMPPIYICDIYCDIYRKICDQERYPGPNMGGTLADNFYFQHLEDNESQLDNNRFVNQAEVL